MKHYRVLIIFFLIIVMNYGYRINGEAEVITLKAYVVESESSTSFRSQLGQDSILLDKPLDVAGFLSGQLAYIDISRKGGVAHDVLLRGFAGDDIAVVIDDCKVYGACPNRMDPPSFHISAQSVESIEVKKGPFNIRQAGSLGGSINLMTAAPEVSRSGRVNLTLGSNQYASASLTFQDTLEKGGYSFNITRQESDPFRDGSGSSFTKWVNYSPEYKDRKAFEIDTWLLKARIIPNPSGKHLLDFTLALDDARSVLYPGLKMDALYDRTWRFHSQFKAQLNTPVCDHILLSLYHNTVSHDMRDSWRLSSTSANPVLANNSMVLAKVQERGYMMKTYAGTTTSGFRLESEKEARSSGNWQYGIQVEYRNWDADNEIMMLKNDMLPNVSTRNTGIYISRKKQSGNWLVQLGMRMDQYRTRAGDSISFLENKRGIIGSIIKEGLFSGFALLQYGMNEDFDLWFGIGRGSRLPDPQEYFLNLNRPGSNPDWIGNPDLKPVVNHEIDFGLTWNQGDFLLESSLFYSDLSNYIYLDQIKAARTAMDQNPAVSYRNLDATIYGMDCSWIWNIYSSLSISGGLAMQRGLKQSPDAPGQSRFLAEIPAAKTNLGISITESNWFFKADCIHLFEQDRTDVGLKETETLESRIVNLRLGIKIIPNWQIITGVDNLFDKQYTSHNAYLRNPFSSGTKVSEPGRNLFMTLSTSF